MVVYQIGADKGRRVTQAPNGAWVVCSPEYEFNGDVIAVFGDPIGEQVNANGVPVYGVPLEPSEQLSADARRAVAAYEDNLRLSEVTFLPVTPEA